MRRRLAATAVLVLALGGTAACGSGSDSSSDPSSSSSANDSIKGLTVTGDFGKAPTVKVDSLKVTKPESATLIEGDGSDLTADDSLEYRILLAKGTDGSTIQSNYQNNTPDTSNVKDLPPSVQDAVVGTPVGSRVALAMPVKELVCGPDPASDCTGDAPQLGLKAADPVVVVMDLIKVAPKPLDGPQGKTVQPPADAPKVIEKDGDVTGIDFSDAPKKAPTKLQVIPLIEGTGDKVTADSTVTIDYFGVVWGQGDTPFDESYTKEPATFGLSGLIKGWQQGLEGVPVGSRVMLIIPSDLGYGDQGSPPSIPGGATLVFVIDVLGASS